MSTTKGCYVGQEIIARIHTYGHVNRNLVCLLLEGPGLPPSGAPLLSEGEPAGRITSSTPDPLTGNVLALGYVPRALSHPGERLSVGKEGPRTATVRARQEAG